MKIKLLLFKVCVLKHTFLIGNWDNHMNWKQEYSRWLSYAELKGQLL